MQRRFLNRTLLSSGWLTGFSATMVLAASSAGAQSLETWIDDNCERCLEKMEEKTGAFILEKGEDALIGRAWLTQHAARSIDIQYFIWSSDNVGILAAEQLLRAAKRGVRVRVLVDDILIDAEDESLSLLAAHENIEIRIYNPNLTVGTSFLDKLVNVVTQFRGINQRMHDKTAIFDGVAGITGGRNMADEYFDFNPDYNFRDRDILLLGRAVDDMSANFEEFWQSDLAVPVEDVVEGEYNWMDVERKAADLHVYADNAENFDPIVRDAIEAAPERFRRLLSALDWRDVEFISDAPGKNDGSQGLGGGGQSTARLIDVVRNAKHSVLIQSPYLVMPKGGIELFEDLTEKGVRSRISTNSLASTDNVPAFSGYHRQRRRLLNAGIELYEYKPRPEIRRTLVGQTAALTGTDPVFALHAKSMVIDDRIIYIGTFNLDPRSANLNTEVGVLIESEALARQLTETIERDLQVENSWHITEAFMPDYVVSRGKRLQLGFVNLLPIEPLL